MSAKQKIPLQDMTKVMKLKLMEAEDKKDI